MSNTALVDLSAIFWHYYRTGDGDLNSNAKRRTLSFLVDSHSFGRFDKVKICVDCPPYKRAELYPKYKANRPEKSESLIHDLKELKKALVDKGWDLLTSQGAEADDIIATYCYAHKDEVITILGIDKDLLQIQAHHPAVNLLDPFNKKIKTAKETLGVEPVQVVDYLALVGDSSDNVPGVPGVGDKTALALLAKYDGIDDIMSNVDTDDAIKPGLKAKLKDNVDLLKLSYRLVTLDYNCEILEQKGKVANMEKAEEAVKEEPAAFEQTEETPPQTKAENSIVHVSEVHNVEYRQSLAPIGTAELVKTSQRLYDSGLYDSVHRKPQSVMAVIMAGRELGLGPIASLASVSIVKGKPFMSAQAMLALCLNNPLCLYFDCVETTRERAVFETHRKGSKNPVKMEFSMKDAIALKGPNPYNKQPATMLRWRCIATLARLVYPDIILGVYAYEEQWDIEDAA